MDYDFQAAEMEYFSIGRDDDDELLELKQAVYSELNEAERRILTLYLDFGSYAAVARELGFAPNTIKHKIREIRFKLT